MKKTLIVIKITTTGKKVLKTDWDFEKNMMTKIKWEVVEMSESMMRHLRIIILIWTEITYVEIEKKKRI